MSEEEIKFKCIELAIQHSNGSLLSIKEYAEKMFELFNSLGFKLGCQLKIDLEKAKACKQKSSRWNYCY